MLFQFGGFVLDVRTRELRRGASVVHLAPKAFDLLRILVENRPWAMSKQDLHARLWPGTFVTDASLATLVNEIRSALGDDARRPRFVRTVHGYGYAFCGSAEARPSPGAGGAACWVRWEGRDIALADGVNLLGRALNAAVRVDRPDVSRRHAQIVVSSMEATLDDLGSRNGTYLGGQLIDRPRPLRDGDEIRLGTATLTFHVASGGGTTQTSPGSTAAAEKGTKKQDAEPLTKS